MGTRAGNFNPSPSVADLILDDSGLADYIERKHGTQALIKGALSAITRVLVEKNICTGEELQEAFKKEVDYLDDRDNHE
jgi:hypothetical protein